MTVAQLEERLRLGSEAERVRLLAKVLREARRGGTTYDKCHNSLGRRRRCHISKS